MIRCPVDQHKSLSILLEFKGRPIRLERGKESMATFKDCVEEFLQSRVYEFEIGSIKHFD